MPSRKRPAVLVVLASSVLMTLGGALAMMGPVAAAQHGGAAPAANEAITAPTTVDPGDEVTIMVPGAAPGGRLELWGPVTTEGTGSLVATMPLVAGSANLTAPSLPASYQLRHVSAKGAVLARREFEVAAVPVSMNVPVEAVIGREFEIVWRGPARPGDRFEFVDVASGTVLGTNEVAGDPASRNVSTLIAPQSVGAAELRYVSGDGSVLQAMPIKLTHGVGWLRTPIEVSAGERFDAEWHGVARPEHVLRIVDRETGTEMVSSVPEGPQAGPLTGTLTAPTRAGAYLVEYADPAADTPVSQVPLKVNPN